MFCQGALNLLKSQKICSEKITEFREIFTLFDKDKSGFISGKELSTCLKCLGQDPEEDEIREIIHSLDINGKYLVPFSRRFCT